MSVIDYVGVALMVVLTAIGVIAFAIYAAACIAIAIVYGCLAVASQALRLLGARPERATTPGKESL